MLDLLKLLQMYMIFCCRKNQQQQKKHMQQTKILSRHINCQIRKAKSCLLAVLTLFPKGGKNRVLGHLYLSL